MRLSKSPFVLTALTAISLLATGCASKRVTQAPPPPPQTATLAPAARIPSVTPGPHCDASLWAHVYTGDPRRFNSPKDRLQIIQECMTISGTIKKAKAEKDG